jgi:hypothetical protein
MAESPGVVAAPLGRLERWAVVGFFLVLLGFGWLVELRSALLSRRMGDLNVFLRAGWAVRSGADLYAVTDDNGFHYCYPPLLAILAAPLADAPAGVDRTGMLPYAATVAICYGLNLLFLALAMQLLASALEGRYSPPAGSRRWWALRLWPVIACLIPIGHTLMRGQVNLLLLALLCGTLASVLKGHPYRAGGWLAGAICLKIIPAFLLILPLWRRDYRFLAGCAGGLVLGLLLVPLAVLGPARTADCYRKLTTVLIAPGLGVGNDESRAEELTNVTATDSQSVLAVLHNTLHPNWATRPPKASTAVRLTSYLICGALTLLTLLAAGRQRTQDPVATTLCWGLLTLDMILLSPVCHLHYFSLSVLVVAGLFEAHWEGRMTVAPGPGFLVLLAFGVVANLLPHFPAMSKLRDGGLAMYAAVALWATGIAVLWTRRRRTILRPAEPAGFHPVAA